MERNNGGLSFTVDLLTEDALKKAEAFKREIKGIVSVAEAEGKKIDSMFSGLGSGAMSKEFDSLNSLSKEAFGELSSKAQQYAKDIQDDTRALSQLEKMQSALNGQYDKGEISLESYVSAQARLSVLHDQIADAITANEQALRTEMSTMDMAGDSISSLQAQVALLTTAYMKLSQAQREGAEGQQILKNLSEVQTKLQTATSAMNQYAGAAGRQFNGLNFSIQQIARELPSLAMGPQMFFLAISNNLPMLTDEIARARKEYAALQAEGKKGVPVWKQVVSSLFSWQTALVGAITLLTMHGDKIISWISSVLKGRDAVMSATDALKKMREAADFESAGSQIAQFERLASLYREIGDNAEEKTRFIEKYKDEIEQTGVSIVKVNDADNLFVDNSDAFIEAINKRTIALAGQQLAQEQYAKALKQRLKDETELAAAEAELERLRSLPADYTKISTVQTTATGTVSSVVETRDELIKAEELLVTRIKEREQAYWDAGNAFMSASNEAEKEAAAILDAAGILGGDEKEAAVQYAKIQNSENQQQAQIRALMDRNAAERIKLAVDLENQVEQARIDAMADGFDKELAQRNLDDKKSMQALEEQKKQYINAVVQGQKEVFDAQENLRASQDQSYVKKMFDPSSVSVDTSVFDELLNRYKEKSLSTYAEVANERDRIESESIDKEEAAIAELLQKFETYEQARSRIQREYGEQRRALYEEDGETLKSGVLQANIDELNRQEQEAIASISETFAMRDSAFESWSASLASKTSKALELMLSEAMEQLSILESTAGANPNDIAKATAAVSQLEKALKTSDRKTESSEATWTDLNGVLADSADIFTELGEKIPGIAGDILSGIGNISTAAVSMANGIAAIGEAASAAEKASAILAIISAAIKVISFVTDTINANREANEAAAQAAWEYAEAMDGIKEAARLDKYDTIFGENALGRFNELIGLVSKNKKEILDSYNVIKQVTSVFSDLDGTAIGKKIRELGAEAVIISDMRSKWQKFWGSDKNVFTFDLADYINEDGTLQLEALQQLYDTYKDGMSETTRQLLESIIQDGEQLQEYLDEMKSYITDIFGDISSEISDSMIEAFEKTGNAAIDAGGLLSDVARSFAKSWIQNKLFEDIFNEDAQQKMFELMGQGNTEGALDFLSQLINQANSLAPQITDYLNGVNGLLPGTQENEQERTSASKGIAQASQDSVDELNGRATAIQGHTFSISSDMKLLVNTSSMMLERLTGIENNTARLEAIEYGIESMRTDMSTIVLKGLKLR